MSLDWDALQPSTSPPLSRAEPTLRLAAFRRAGISAEVRFFVPGVPQPSGSKTGFPVRRKSGKMGVAIVETSKGSALWRAKVSLAASQHFEAPLRGPVEFSFEFVMPRPKHHFWTGKRAGVLRPDAPLGHTGIPDTTKLIRSTEDALKGIAWVDDCQVVVQSAAKLYGDVPGCWVIIRPWGAEPPATPMPEPAPATRSLFD